MKIFQTHQIRQIDALTIQKEPIDSFSLMKRASQTFFNKLITYLLQDDEIVIVAGSGNNGGDALVIAKFLTMIGRQCHIYLVNPKNHLSDDCQKAYNELNAVSEIIDLKEAKNLEIKERDIVIDGLFGSGLNRPLEGIYQEVVDKINQSNAKIFSIDIPSGLFGEDNSQNHHNHIINATYTFTFQTPKPCFFMAENESHVGEWSILDIQLHPEAIEEIGTSYFYTEIGDIKKMLHTRNRFSHKGTYGHVLLIAGSFGMMGAAQLAVKAALRTGCGLVSAHIPQKGYEIMQIAVPEAIVSLDDNNNHFSQVPDLEKYNGIAVGPGIGTSEECKKAFRELLLKCKQPLVIDADALNILGQEASLWELLPQGSVLTPHPKEFERITGQKSSGYKSWLLQQEFSERYKVTIVLKGAFTSISLPDGTLHVNPTGNSGMATAGSGDTLTGIIVSLMAQGYIPEEAAIIGTWIHGKAGDIAANQWSEDSIIARDIIENIGEAWMHLRKNIIA